MHTRLTAALAVALFAGLALAQDPPSIRTDLTPEDLARVQAATAPVEAFSRPESFEQLPAGTATVISVVNDDIFSFGQANLSLQQQERFKLGGALFRKLWVSAPSSTEASDGLGPLFNARSDLLAFLASL